MQPRALRSVAVLILVLATGAAAPSHAAPAVETGLSAGTGHATIDPLPAHFPIRNGNDSPLTGIHDSLEARALVLQQSGAQAIVVVLDAITVPDAFYEAAVALLSERYHVPVDHILICATHAHTVPWTLGNGYGERVMAGMLAAIDEARRRLEPVRVGTGSGQAYINMNRDELTPTGFILGQDPEGPSDKTVRVGALYRADGSRAAIIANYAVHAVSLYSSDTAGEGAALLSADIPGVVDRFVDEHYGPPRTETFWTSGAAGDQNPILMSFHAEPDSDGRIATSDLKAAGFTLTRRLGQALALEVIRIVDRIEPLLVAAPIRAAQAVFSCPDKADPALQRSVRLSYLGVGPLDLLGISGEVGTRIDQHLREKIGARAPLLLTLTNGYSGYLPDEASYARGKTFEVGKALIAPGCAERLIIERGRALLSTGVQ